ncbi:hypothetical protein QRZ34_27595 [Klebsiella michiganensis]|jgi:hypothetical protein|uniref:hypothetical protein n=1 Tax=Klebsiella michiganensis TaxID=1134687 RepID=UPI0025702426|nr:hypothetical protein [Klebsiella michiganensis]MDL4454795.1 hypothetical protein [Klebsiella michiganensis]
MDDNPISAKHSVVLADFISVLMFTPISQARLINYHAHWASVIQERKEGILPARRGGEHLKNFQKGRQTPN